MAYISEEYGFAFFAAPATGSSAVIKALQDAGIGEFWPAEDVIENDRRIAPSKHSTFANLRAAGIAERVEGLVKVVGVRNIFALYVAKFLRNRTSRMRNVRNKKSWIYRLPEQERENYIARLRDHQSMDFPSFLANMLQRNREYFDSSYHCDMDIYLHQENLSREFFKIAKKFNLPSHINVEPYNVTGAMGQGESYQDYYDGGMIDMVYSRNASFFTRFPEYTFEGLKLRNGGVITTSRSVRQHLRSERETAHE